MLSQVKPDNGMRPSHYLAAATESGVAAACRRETTAVSCSPMDLYLASSALAGRRFGLALRKAPARIGEHDLDTPVR